MGFMIWPGKPAIYQLLRIGCGLQRIIQPSKVGMNWLIFPKRHLVLQTGSSKFETFLAKFGDRNGHGYGSESLISTPTWRDQPILVIQLAAQYLSEAVEPPRQQRECAHRAIEEEVRELCSLCPDSQIVEDFLEQLRFARQIHADRGDPQPPYRTSQPGTASPCLAGSRQLVAIRRSAFRSR